MKKILVFLVLVFCCTVGMSETSQQYNIDPNGLTPSLVKLAIPKSEKDGIEIFNISMRNTFSGIMNSELTNNIIKHWTSQIKHKRTKNI